MSKDNSKASAIASGKNVVLAPLSLENSFKGKGTLMGESQTAQQSLHSSGHQYSGNQIAAGGLYDASGSVQQ